MLLRCFVTLHRRNYSMHNVELAQSEFLRVLGYYLFVDRELLC